MRSLVFAAAISGSFALFQLSAETIRYSALASDSASCFIVNQLSGKAVYQGGAADRNCRNYKPALGVQGTLGPDYVTAQLDWTRRDAPDGGDIYEFSISADVFYAVNLPDPLMTAPEETQVRVNLERSIDLPFTLPARSGVGVLQSLGQPFTNSSGGWQALAHVDFPDLLLPGTESIFTITISPDVILTFSRLGVAGGGGITGFEYYVAPAGPADVPTPEPATGLVTAAGAAMVAIWLRRAGGTPRPMQ